MGVTIDAQLAGLLKSVLLGVGFALLYDALRALRLRRRRKRGLTHGLDALYCLVLAAASLAFTLRVGGGELRLYMLFGALAGAAGSFWLLSPLFVSLWALWAEILVGIWRIFRLPQRGAKKFYGKLHKLSKRGFLFAQKLFIIKNYRRFARSARRRTETKEGSHGAAKRAPRPHPERNFAGSAAVPRGRAPAQPARGDPRG